MRVKPISNAEIARILGEIGTYLEMQRVAFKPRAYQRVAETIQGLPEEVADLYEKGGVKALEGIPGVGASIAEHIEELLTTGRLRYYEEFRKRVPVRLDELLRVEGLGPQSIHKLFVELGVKTLADLGRAARQGKIRTLEGFGEKSEAKILASLGFLERSGSRFILGFVMPEIRKIEERLRDVRGVARVTVAGSVRRRKETIGDVDILAVAADSARIMDRFVAMPEVVRIIAKGTTKSAVKLASGLDVDLRVVPPESYGAALNYFTGSKDHNVALRQIAISKSYKLKEYGLFEIADQRRSTRGSTRMGKEKVVAGRTEEELYKKLGMDYIEPELRENRGEIELALRQATLGLSSGRRQGKPGGLPKLVGYGDLKGDLQTQTDWTDGSASIEEMARAAAARGLEYIAITDHTKRLAMTHGLDDRRLLRQVSEIERVNRTLHASRSAFRVLSGTECDILPDGSLDISDAVLSKLDVVGVSVHSNFNLPRAAQTRRIIRAMSNPHADILFHPTGRIINKRAPYDVDMDAVIHAAKETGTVLEVDALPDRADLDDEYVRRCVEAGVMLAIDSDAHAPVHFSLLEYGIAQARRGWAERKDIVNTRPVAKMKGLLKRGK
jgi:DNA polymerase (family 10)